MFKYTNDHYQILWHGYHWANWFKVFQNATSKGRGREELNYDLETTKMLPKELLRGFDELTVGLSAKRKLKTV